MLAPPSSVRHTPGDQQSQVQAGQLPGLQPSVSKGRKSILLHAQSKPVLGKSRILGGNHIIREGRASSFVLFFKADFGANNLSFLE